MLVKFNLKVARLDFFGGIPPKLSINYVAITFALEVYHLGIKMKTNMAIVLFFSLSPTANCPCECDGVKYE